MTWKSITLGKYQQIERINKTDLPDIDKVLHTACIVFDKTEHEVNNEKPAKVLKMIKKIHRVFEKPLNAKVCDRIGKYVVNYDISRITFGQYIELSFFIANGFDKNIHYILATMSNRWMRKHTSRNHRERAEYFLSQPVELIIGALNRIQESYSQFNNQYKNLFGIDTEVSGNVQDDEFNKRHGWIYSATQVAEHERITLDQAFALPVRQAFNALIFLKAKCKYEVEQFNTSNKRPV